jgi:hypothetical protein
METQEHTVLTLDLDQITNFISLGWDLGGGNVTHSSLIQSVFRLDRVKSNSCDCPEKISVDASFSSGSS